MFQSGDAGILWKSLDAPQTLAVSHSECKRTKIVLGIVIGINYLGSPC